MEFRGIEHTKFTVAVITKVILKSKQMLLFRVQLGEELLGPWALSFGVPQGSSVSPMLFDMYMKPWGKGHQEIWSKISVSRCCPTLSLTTTAVDAIQTLKCCLESVLG